MGVIIIFSCIILLLIPSVIAENRKVVQITDNGSLYGIVSPQAYYFKGENERIYVVYARNDRFPDVTYPNNHIDSFIRYYDLENDTVSEEFLVGLGHGDDHGAPTLCIDDRGYIHVFYGSHSDKSQYSVSASPEDISLWINKTHTIPDTYGYTYPKAVFADGLIYVFFRSRSHGGSSLNQGNYAFIKSEDYGDTWSEQIEFVDASTEYAISVYPTMVRYVNGVFHVTWYIKTETGADYYGPGSEETRYNAYYAKSYDGGVTWTNVDGSYTSSYITIREMDKYYQVYNTTTQTKVVGSFISDWYGPGLDFVRYRTTTAPYMDISPLGVPYIGFNPTDEGKMLVYWNKTQWKRISGEYNSYKPFVISDTEIYLLSWNVYRYDGQTISIRKAGLSLNDFVVSTTDSRNITYAIGLKENNIYLINISFNIPYNPIFAGGDGTIDNPYRISKIEHLDSIRFHLDNHFVLLNNLDFNNDSSYIGKENKHTFLTGEGWTPIGNWDNDYFLITDDKSICRSNTPFKGILNGNGHTISNLYINKPNDDNLGLFGSLNGFVYDVGVINVNISGNEHLGSIAGTVSGTISQSFSSGLINSNTISITARIGGFVGYLQDGGFIYNCWSGTNIFVPNGERIAGLIGQINEGATVRDSYSFGFINSSISWSNGGLIGRNLNADNDASTPNCFWDLNKSRKMNSQGGIGKTTEDMMNIITYFDEKWIVDQGKLFGPISHRIQGILDLLNGFSFLQSWFLRRYFEQESPFGANSGEIESKH